MPDDKLTRLYAEYGPIIYARCRRMLADESAAEDATQETFMRVYRHIERAPDSRQALAWIYRIATNYCLNEIRDRRLRPDPHAEVPEVAGRAPEPWLADRDLAMKLIVRAPGNVRAVAWLTHVDGLEQAEVASVLGISRRTVVNHLATFAKNAHKFVRRSA
jgi:RNA polymerase sigma-70 factor (ECF subfamily)